MDNPTGGAGGSAGPGGRGRLRWWIAGGVAVVVVLAVGGPFVYIHFVEGPPPAALSLPAAGAGGAGSSSTTAAGTSGISGIWSVGTGSQVGYRVSEVLIGQQTTAVGRSSTVSGTFTVHGTTVTGGRVTVDMSSVASDQSQRNAQFDGRIMDVTAYPTASLQLTSPIVLGPAPAVGQVGHARATGTLTMHGETHTVTFPVQFERSAGSVSVLADVPIIFATWGIANPSIAGFVTTASTGTLEALLVLTTGAGNPAVGAGGSGSTSTPAGGGPVTVPSSTIPPLSVPSRS